MKIVIFIVIVLSGSVVVSLTCSGYIVYCWIQRGVRIKQLQGFLKSDHWLRRYCIWWSVLFWTTLYGPVDNTKPFRPVGSEQSPPEAKQSDNLKHDKNNNNAMLERYVDVVTVMLGLIEHSVPHKSTR